MKYCVYNHNIISRGILRHYMQFRQTRDGDRLPVFPDDKAVIFIDSNGRYHVESVDGEAVFIGTGFDEAIRRIYFAQPDVEIEVIANGKRFTLEEWEFLNDEPT